MESRPSGLPFSRPQSQQTLRDPRFATIPASQYASQPNTPRTDTLHQHDPFLRRRNDLEDLHRNTSLAQPPRQYALPSTSAYPSSHTVTISDTAQNNGQMRRGSRSAGALFGGVRMDRFGSQSSEGVDPKEQQSSNAPTFTFGPSQQVRGLFDNSNPHLSNRPGSPKSSYGGADHPPPPSFTGRQMLPPSPQISSCIKIPRLLRPRQPSSSLPFSNGRDLPALSTSTVHRPTSSMSISSMLGSDNAQSSREPALYNHSNGPSSVVGNFLASPSRPPSNATSPSGMNQASSIFSTERSSSPNKYKLYPAQGNRQYRSYSGGLEQRSQLFNRTGSPVLTEKELAHGASISQFSPNSVTSPQKEWRPYKHDQVKNNGRPNSQPNGVGTPSLLFDGRNQLEETETLRQQQTARKHYLELEESNQEMIMPQQSEKRKSSRDRPQQRAQQLQSARAGAPRSPKHEQEVLNGPHQPSASRSVVGAENPISRHRSEVGRPFERTNNSSGVAQSPFSPDALRRLREERLNQSPTHLQPRIITNTEERHPLKYPGPPVTFASSTEPPALLEINEQQSREDITANHRSSLAMLIENNKRGGRFSPLPQAVQGAQGRTSGPASDPGIKNEFARMFSGIGSGVGSAGPTGSGTNTPFAPPSPTMSHGPQRRTPLNNRGDLASASKPRAASKNTRKTRKSKDGLKAGLEDEEASISIGPAGRVVRRNRGNHHHHPHHVHHDHRHHNLEEVEASNERVTPTLANGQRVNTPSQARLGSHKHHNHNHHHHQEHHHHHHHHQEPKAPRLPITTIKSDLVLESVCHLARKHLGSVMYSSTLEPAAANFFSNSKFGFRSTPTPMPRYNGKENCTYTVQIPKIYLEAQEREEICRRRALWGTDIYTDDSDVLAAAIHSGWIRGEFGEDIDASMLEVKPAAKAGSKADEAALSQDVFTSPPEQPMVPPPGRELHLTLLVLPTLEKYASHVAHGIKSRSWGSTHDGVSFRIEKMEWVNEKRSNGEDRNGEARRKRMRSQYGASGMLGGPPVRLNTGSLGAGAGVGLATNSVVAEV